MINVSDITKALASQLMGNGVFSSELKTPNVKVSDYANINPDRAPWCGVYRRTAKGVPRTLRTPPSWLMTYKIAVVLQASSVVSGEDCEEKLENLVELALTAILEDRTFGGVITMVNGWDVEYTYLEAERETTYFQGALINLEVEANVN